MKKSLNLYLGLIFTFLTCYTFVSGQTFSRNGYIQQITIDTTSNPIKLRVKGTMRDWFVVGITITPINDLANTQIVRIKSGGCGYAFFVIHYLDTVINLPTSRPFNLNLYLDWDSTVYRCPYGGRPDLNTDSVFIRYNQILATDEADILEKQITIAPNPNNGTFTLQHDANIQIQSATIYNSQGALIQKMTDVGDKIEMPTTTKGIYFIRLQTDQGEVVKKILLE